MDANKILELIYEHEELSRRATKVLNYYYDEKRIIENNPDLFFSRKMITESIGRLEDTIDDCCDRLNELYNEYHNLTGKDIIIKVSEFDDGDTTTSKVRSEFDNGDTLTSKVRKDVIKSLKECDSNE